MQLGGMPKKKGKWKGGGGKMISGVRNKKKAITEPLQRCRGENRKKGGNSMVRREWVGVVSKRKAGQWASREY